MKKRIVRFIILLMMFCSFTACAGPVAQEAVADGSITAVNITPTYELITTIPSEEEEENQESADETMASATEAGAKSTVEAASEAKSTVETASEAESTVETASEAESTVEATPEATEEVTSEEKPMITTITITATGDCTLGTTQKQGYEDSFDDVYDSNGGAEYFFDHVRDIFEEDDMTLINLECSLTTSTDRQEKLWNLKGKPEYIDILTGSSIETVSMGNNHRLDYGVSGFEETVQLLENAEITYAYDNVVGIYETKGITIGYVSVNEHYDGTLVEEFLQDGIAELKEMEVDLIIACCHWGIESTSKLDDYQVELGYKCVDWGADLVIGNHPHVLQAINQYHGKYIVYSLGNFCFGGNKNPKDKDTMIFQQTFTFEAGELKTDDNIRIIPCSISSVTNKNNFQPTPATGSEAERIIKKINSYSEEFGIQFDSEGYLQ